MAKKAQKVAAAAREACEAWNNYFKHNIDQYHDMHSFVLGDQWSQDESSEMIKTFKKVPLTSNKLGTMSNSLLGEQQQNTPQLQVVPLENCDEQTAQLREDIVKNIILSTDATTVYQVAAGQSFIGGFGAFAWVTEYSHNKSFDLDIVPQYFKDSSKCYWDVGADKIDKTDGMVCGWVSRMTRTKFREVYGKDLEEKITSSSGRTTASKEEIQAVTNSNGNNGFSWSDEDGITINDNFVRKQVKETLYRMSNGKTYNQDEIEELMEKSLEINRQIQEQQFMMGEVADIEAQEGDMSAAGEETEEAGFDESFMTLYDEGQEVTIEDKRDTKKSVITHYKIAGDYILEDSEFPCEDLPLIFLDQNSYYDKNGKQMCRSFFGDAKDTQRYINYLRTQSAYILKVSRYDQYMGSKKNVASNDTAATWRDPSSMQGLLTYDESPSGAKPEQLRPPELSASLQAQYQLAIEDLYTCTGLYPTRMGNQGSETSGAAIDARTRQGSYTTYVAFNSVNRAIAAGGNNVNSMIPRVYDAERVMSVTTNNEGTKTITVNQQTDEYGERIENDIRKGTYQVRLKPGPSFEGQKQQALESLQQVLQANPQAFSLVADLYADNLPLANTIELKNRLKTLVPPGIIEAGKTGQSPQDMGQQGPSPEEQAAQAEMQIKQQEIQIKQQELQVRHQDSLAKIEIEKMKLQIAEMELAASIERERMEYMAETQRTESDNAIAHADNMVKILTHKI
tara:strand:+ start:3271 stop:5478 length:2208 start_codon:yes stop_codon:yes gene_type:complete